MKSIIILIIAIPFFCIGCLLGIAKMGLCAGYQCFEDYSDKIALKAKTKE